MDAQKKLLERKELFDNAIAFKRNKRVPMLSNFFTWKIYDAGYTAKEAIYDYAVMEDVVRQFIERYQFDAYFDLGTRNPMRVTNAFGAGRHYIDEENDTVLVDDHTILLRDEYSEYITGKNEWYWSKGFKRTAKPGLTIGELKNAVQEFLVFGQFSEKMSSMLSSEYGALRTASGYAMVPFENLFLTLRGMREASLDLRKSKAEIKECMDFMFETESLPMLEQSLALESNDTAADISCAFLGHSVLNTSQFEEFYWPYLKAIIDKASAAHKTIFIMCEATMLRFAEFFEDVPKGVLFVQLEQDDVFEFRKRLPNIAFTGGMPTNLLGFGTPEECIEYAKRLIGELGDGYAFGTDKMMSYRNDAKRENLIAVCDFVREYQI
ncbi:MAG: hypothetical protein FWG30_03120 [Eubacteriaceae bacterium]|nr:hypothetical protein [Eubacteriaceae bacterium]